MTQTLLTVIHFLLSARCYAVGVLGFQTLPARENAPLWQVRLTYSS